MKTKLFTLIVSAILIIIGATGCSNHDFNPDDYTDSYYFSNTYGIDGTILNVSENGIHVECSGCVRFQLKKDSKGDFDFVDVLPGESSKKYTDIPLASTEEGMTFEIKDSRQSKPMTITGTIKTEIMTVNINY